MKRLALALLVVACGPSPDPHSIDPGDQGAIGWTPPERVSGPVVDCGGGSRGTVVVRESGTTVQHCRIDGVVRVRGDFATVNTDEMRASSRLADHVSRVRAAAPAWATLDDVEIHTDGRIPLYVGPGVSMLTLRSVRIYGPSDSVAIYLDAESHGTSGDVTIDARYLRREAIAIDASDGNDLNVTILGATNGGVYLYRNCGEAGTARHTTPSDNRIVGSITGAPVAVWLGSREGDRSYCAEDADGSYGSSVSDFDHARRNVVCVLGAVVEGRSAEGNETCLPSD